jgi:hypothetical protein
VWAGETAGGVEFEAIGRQLSCPGRDRLEIERLVERFCKLCDSVPQVQAIRWWSFNHPGYIPNSGL